MARVQLFLSSHHPRRMGRRPRTLLLAWTLALLLPQLHSRAITPASQQQPPPPFDFWALVSPWLQKHGWLGFAVVGGLALFGYVLSQAQNIEAARRLLGLERKEDVPSSANSTHGSNSPLSTGGTFQPGGAQFIGGKHIHHNHSAPTPKIDSIKDHDTKNIPKSTPRTERLVGSDSFKHVLSEQPAVEESSLIEEIRITTEMQEAGVITQDNAIVLQNQRITEIRILRLLKP